MFAAILEAPDAARATALLQKIDAHRLRFALTGGPAIEARLRAHGHPSFRRPLNDVDLVVDSFASIPPSIVDDFLVHHVHPHAAEGKLLLQLVDAEHAVRVDLFRAFGRTLSRASRLDEDTDPIDVVSIEDLAARTTAHVCGALLRSRPIDTKHVTAFRRLGGLGEAKRLEEAWSDHREGIDLSFGNARHVARLAERHPELLVEEQYSTEVTPCDRCEDHGSFRRSDPQAIVRVLGYW